MRGTIGPQHPQALVNGLQMRQIPGMFGSPAASGMSVGVGSLGGYMAQLHASLQLPHIDRDFQTQDSAEASGHDLGFLSLSNEKSSIYDDTSSSGSGGRRQSSTKTHFPLSDDKCMHDCPKGRRGRPIGAKDKHPRVPKRGTSDVPPGPAQEGPKKTWKIILTAQQAVEIYNKRTIGGNSRDCSERAPKISVCGKHTTERAHSWDDCSEEEKTTSRSREVAEQYGVNSKTIRDIWNRATWVKATRPSWTPEEEEEYLQSRCLEGGGIAVVEASRHDKGNSSVEAGGGGGASDVKRSIRGRPKGACDVRPRRPRAKRRPDGCAGSDGWSKDEQTSDALEWISNISSTQNLSLPLAPKGLALEVGGGGVGAGPGLHLKKLPSDPMGPAFRKQDKMSHGVQGDLTSLIFNSSSNTSQSQTSSYPTDDSHSGDQASDGGSGSGHGNSPPQYRISPQHHALVQMPTLEAVSRFAHVHTHAHAHTHTQVPGLRPVDSTQTCAAYRAGNYLAPALNPQLAATLQQQAQSMSVPHVHASQQLQLISMQHSIHGPSTHAMHTAPFSLRPSAIPEQMQVLSWDQTLFQ